MLLGHLRANQVNFDVLSPMRGVWIRRTGTMEWNGGMDWTGMRKVLRRMRTWYHTTILLKFLVCGAVSLIRILSRGDRIRGLEHSFSQGMI